VVITDIGDRSCHYRICIFDPINFSKGIGKKASRLIFDYLFDDLGLESIDLEVYPFNQRGLAAYKTLGFEIVDQVLDEEAQPPYNEIIQMTLKSWTYQSNRNDV